MQTASNGLGGADLKGRNSHARRRRLIQGGLLGETAVAPTPLEPMRHDIAYDVDERAQTEQAIDVATNAILATDPDRTSPLWPDSRSAVNASETSSTETPAGIAAIQSLIRGKRDVTWVFSGDNVIQGAFATRGSRSCVEIFSERVRAELRRAGDVVINTGVAGDTARQLLATLKRRVLRYRPEVVGLSVGLNDAKQGVAGRTDFRRDVREILDRIRNAGSVPLLILPHPIYTPATPKRADLPHYVEILRDESQRDEVPCVDHWNDWLENWPEPLETRSRLFDGRMQLNADGHQHLAALIFCTLEIYDPYSLACRGPDVDLL